MKDAVASTGGSAHSRMLESQYSIAEMVLQVYMGEFEKMEQW